MNHFCTRPNETRLEQKRIKSVRARYARRSRAKTFCAKTDHLGMISFARVNSATLFSAKVNHLIKCAFYTNTPLKKPKQKTIRIFVINCMPCCNFTVNIGFLAAHEDRNTVKIAFFSDSPLTEMNHFCSKRPSWRDRCNLIDIVCHILLSNVAKTGKTPILNYLYYTLLGNYKSIKWLED